MSYNIRITYFGIIRSISSWAKIARNIVNSLLEKGIDISIYETKGFLYEENFSLGKLENLIMKKIHDIVFTFEHPFKYPLLPKSKKRIGFLVYEFTTLPKMWTENINKYLDLVFVPSKFTYNVFLKSGVEHKKLKLLRFGFDPNYYYPTPRKDKIRNFLTISSPHKREGLDICLESFYLAFKDIDDVSLTVKLSYIPFKKEKHFEIKNFKILLEEYSNKLGAKLKLITNKLSEEEMGILYRSSDAYFSLSKSESFGLCFLESLASNRPVICMNYSGQTDFLSEKNSVFVKYSLVNTNGEEYERTQEKQLIAIPDINDCVKKLRHIYKYNFEKDIHFNREYYTWDRITDEFIEILKESI